MPGNTRSNGHTIPELLAMLGVASILALIAVPVFSNLLLEARMSAAVATAMHAINLARQGLVVFTYDMVGYNDSQQVPHTFSGKREYLWGLSLSGLQLWDSIRALDFLESLPFVKIPWAEPKQPLL